MRRRNHYKYDLDDFKPLVVQEDVEQTKKLRRSLADKNDPVAVAIQREKLDWFWQAMRGLPYKHQRVLSLRFGLLGDHPKTLQKIGRRLSLTGARINQIERSALLSLMSQLKRSSLYYEESGGHEVTSDVLDKRITTLHGQINKMRQMRKRNRRGVKK